MSCCNNKDEGKSIKTLKETHNTNPKVNTVTQRNPWQVASIVLATALVFTLAFGVLWVTNIIHFAGMNDSMAMKTEAGSLITKDTTILQTVMPASVTLPIKWGDTGVQLRETGIIDEKKFTQLYESRGGMSDMMKSMLYDTNLKEIIMTKENAGDLLNLFWAFGLANKNAVLSEGPIMDVKYGGDPAQFASTGGWPLSTGTIKDHYNMHSIMSLSEEQQSRVERVSQNIYRPCCNNATYFPDCNHGMAMLGLLELLAGNDVSEEDMYDIAKSVNTYWFTDTYETIAAYFDQNGVNWDDVSSKDLLSASLSSGSGFQKVKASLTQPVTAGQSGGGCSV